MAADERQDDITGTTFLVTLMFVDEQDDIIDEYHTSGIVEEVTEDDVIKLRRLDGSIFQLPYDDDTFEEAKPGEYRNVATGEVIDNPDYIMVWDIRIENKADIEAIKIYGYIEE